MQERGNVARALRYGNDFDPLVNDAIDDKVGAYRKEQHRIVRKVFALVTDAWSLPK